jgi:hypothetical protein
MKILLIIIGISFQIGAFSQTDSLLIKTYYSDHSTLFEEYSITLSDSLRNGGYKRFNSKGKPYVSGYYKENQRSGIWDFYNKYSGYVELIERYDYTLQKEIFYKDIYKRPAHFPGGDEEFINYVQTNKQLDKLTNIKGEIIVGFAVDSIGNVNNIKILRSLRTDIDSLVIDILQSSPKWVLTNKEALKSELSFTLPIKIEK